MSRAISICHSFAGFWCTESFAKYLFLMAIFAVPSVMGFTGTGSLHGCVYDKESGDPLPGIHVFIPELKTGTASDANGNFRIDRLPERRLLIQVSGLGFTEQVIYVNLQGDTGYNLVMESAVAELSEVVVTGLSQSSERKRTPLAISSISAKQLQQASSTNLIDALTKVPGVSQLSTGNAISKPVIRGLGYNRVLVVNDGIRQEGQQWGDEHGIEIDEYSIDHAEILKGPAALSYGSDAMAGVINFLPALPLPEGQINGQLLQNYQSNQGMFGTSLHMAGNLPGKFFDARLSQKQAHAFSNARDGLVFNSGFHEYAAKLTLGTNASWGYSHLILSAYNLLPGIVLGERDSATGKFSYLNKVNDTLAVPVIANDKELGQYFSETPHQDIQHFKAVWNNSLIKGRGNIKSTLGWQQNRRMEYNNPLHPDAYGLYFLTNTFNYDLRYLFPEKNQWQTSAGINGMYQLASNPGSAFLIPDYNLFDAGVFVMTKKTWNQFDVHAGIRADRRKLDAADLWISGKGNSSRSFVPGYLQEFEAFSRTFSGYAGSLGIAWQINENAYTKLNLARGFRMPLITELSSNGAHEGSIQYMIGSVSLRPESSLQGDYGLGWNTKHLSAELSVFFNSVSNYIYTKKLQSSAGADSLSDGFMTYVYTQGNARLYGGEFQFDIHPHPLDWLHLENNFSVVYGDLLQQPLSMRYLPFMPAPRWSGEARAEKKRAGKSLGALYLKVGIEHTLSQNRIYSAAETETITPSYTLWHLGAGGDVLRRQRKMFSVYLSVSNLMNAAYQSHLSRLKYAPVNPVTGYRGVWNMGRNVSLKIIIPLELKQAREIPRNTR